MVMNARIVLVQIMICARSNNDNNAVQSKIPFQRMSEYTGILIALCWGIIRCLLRHGRMLVALEKIWNYGLGRSLDHARDPGKFKWKAKLQGQIEKLMLLMCGKSLHVSTNSCKLCFVRNQAPTPIVSNFIIVTVGLHHALKTTLLQSSPKNGIRMASAAAVISEWSGMSGVQLQNWAQHILFAVQVYSPITFSNPQCGQARAGQRWDGS